MSGSFEVMLLQGFLTTQPNHKFILKATTRAHAHVLHALLSPVYFFLVLSHFHLSYSSMGY